MVPDAGHSRLIRSFEAIRDACHADDGRRGRGDAGGAWLGGERGVLLLQSSGVGNCINMLSLPVICRHAAIDDRHDARRLGEFNPWQIPMGRARGPRSKRWADVNKVDEPDLRRCHRAGRGASRFQHLEAGRGPARTARARRQELQGACSQMTNPNALAPPRRRQRTGA